MRILHCEASSTHYLYIYIYICRVPIWGAPFTVEVSKPKPNRPNTMNLVEKRAWELGLCKDAFNGRAGSLGNWIVYSVVGGKSRLVLGPQPRMISASPFLMLHQENFFASSELPSPFSWNLPDYISFCSLHLGRSSIDCAGRHLSVCPIQRFPQLAMSSSG